MTQGPLKVLFIGCGNIAGGFDMGVHSNAWPCTHAGAFRRDGRYDLLACVEPDSDKRQRFMEFWNIEHGFASWADVHDTQLNFDVVSICSPTEFHARDVEEALRLHPRLIFCEKPVTKSYRETLHLAERCESAAVLFMINHTRRWDPKLALFRQQLNDGTFGELHSVVGYYNKGVINNGSHMLDLLLYFFGDVQILATGQAVCDYSDSDPTIPALLQTRKGKPVHLVTSSAADYAFFELQFICSRGVFTMRDGGLNWINRSTIESARFRGYRNLDAGTVEGGGYEEAMLRAVDNIHCALMSGGSLASDGHSAAKAQELCEKLLNRL